MLFSTRYTLGFSAVVCVACSLLVSSVAVGLRQRQDANALLEKRRNVLMAAGLLKPGESADRARVQELFQQIVPKVFDMKTGEYVEDINAETYDPIAAQQDPAMSKVAPENQSKIKRIPNYGLVYQVMEDGKLKMLVFPIQGMGLWSTLYGFVAIDKDANTILGITYYQHGETPGLGGEVDNPKWKASWIGRKVFDQNWNVAIRVIKGPAASPQEAPHEVDGLSGATLTSQGVTAMLQFWLGENGYGPYLRKFKESGRV